MTTLEQHADNFADLHPPFTPQEALVEANRCLYCYDAPCTAACPTHIDVPRFIKKIASGNLKGSAAAILEANILGLSCSRVCPVDVLCEGACVMHARERNPIQIARLQRHAMEAFYANGRTLRAPVRSNGRRVACIGGGPASLACAAELQLAGFAVTIFDKNEQAGGLNAYGVAEYKFPRRVSQLEVDLVRSLGVEFRQRVEIGRDLSLDALEREFDAIFIGAGLGAVKKLDIPGEDLPFVQDAVTFIAQYKGGQPVTVGRRVVVIGGGNTAIDAAVAAARLGAEDVVMVYRRGEEHMPAFHFEYEHAKRDGVRFLWHMRPVSITPGNLKLLSAAGSEITLHCDTVISAIGQSRLFELLRGCAGVELRNGNVAIDPATGCTGNPKYFAGGDCVNGGREVVDAVASGKRAALGMIGALHG